MQLRAQRKIPLAMLDILFGSEQILAIMRGRGTHLPALDIIARIVPFTQDVDRIKAIIAAVLPVNYEGNTLDEVERMVSGALSKDFDKPARTPQSQSAIALKEVQRNGIEAVADQNGEVFVGIPQTAGGVIYHQLRSTPSKAFFRLMVLRATDKPLKHEPLTELLDNLEANALHTLSPVSIHLRWARDNDQLVLDPGWPNADRILVKRSGWTIGRAEHVRFRRPSGFGAMPRPGTGKGLNRLTKLLGLEGRNAVLFIIFLMNCMRPNGPYMFLIVEGVQGSGKSALSTVIRRIVDPNAVPKGRLPKNEHELMIIASENFLLLFDNASSVRWEISDSLCAIATASGFSTRRYYTDNELRTFLVCRPVLLNGIGQFADRPDLLERSIQLHLPKMPNEKRLTEKQLGDELEKLLPDVLGELLDAASAALAGIDEIPPPTGVRMADAAHWAIAAEKALGFKPGTVHAAMIDDQHETMIDRALGDPLVLAIIEIVQEVRAARLGEGYRGRVSELLDVLRKDDRRVEKWVPGTPAHLSNQLKRLIPAFATLGVIITFPPRQSRGQEVEITFVPDGIAAKMDDSGPRGIAGMKSRI